MHEGINIAPSVKKSLLLFMCWVLDRFLSINKLSRLIRSPINMRFIEMRNVCFRCVLRIKMVAVFF